MALLNYWTKAGNLYDIWAGRGTYRAYHQFIMDLIGEENLSPNSHVYDAGGGCGQYAISLAQRGLRVTSTDISSKMQDIGRKRAERIGVGDRISWCVEDLEKSLQWPDSYFDLVLCIHSIYSVISNPEKLIKEFARVAKPGALIIFSGLKEKCNFVDSLRYGSFRQGYLKTLTDLGVGLFVFGLQRIYSFGSKSERNMFLDETKAHLLWEEAGLEVFQKTKFLGYFNQNDIIVKLRKKI